MNERAEGSGLSAQFHAFILPQSANPPLLNPSDIFHKMSALQHALGNEDTTVQGFKSSLFVFTLVQDRHPPS